MSSLIKSLVPEGAKAAEAVDLMSPVFAKINQRYMRFKKAMASNPVPGTDVVVRVLGNIYSQWESVTFTCKAVQARTTQLVAPEYLLPALTSFSCYNSRVLAEELLKARHSEQVACVSMLGAMIAELKLPDDSEKLKALRRVQRHGNKAAHSAATLTFADVIDVLEAVVKLLDSYTW